MQIECPGYRGIISDLPSLWCFNSIILSAIATVNEVKTEMCFKSSIGLSHPIYEIVTSQRQWCSNIKFFSNHESEGTMSYILGVTQLSGCSKVENYKTYEK